MSPSSVSSVFRAAGPFPCGNAFFGQHFDQLPFSLSSKPGDGSYQAFLANETRYSSLARKFPDRAKDLFAKSKENSQQRVKHCPLCYTEFDKVRDWLDTIPNL